MPRPSGTSAIPSRAMRCAGQPLTGWPRTSTWPERAVGQSQDRPDGGGLSHPVASHQRHRFAACDREAHAVQHVARAVERVQVASLEEGRASRFLSPRYASRTRGLSRMAAAYRLEDAPVDQHGNRVRDREHGIHVVLDEHQRPPLATSPRSASTRRASSCRARRAARRQEQLRIGGQHHGDFELPAARRSSARRRARVAGPTARTPAALPPRAPRLPGRRGTRARGCAWPAHAPPARRTPRRSAREDVRRLVAASDPHRERTSGAPGSRPRRGSAPGPEVARSSPESRFKSVDLPAPFGR